MNIYAKNFILYFKLVIGILSFIFILEKRDQLVQFYPYGKITGWLPSYSSLMEFLLTSLNELHNHYFNTIESFNPIEIISMCFDFNVNVDLNSFNFVN